MKAISTHQFIIISIFVLLGPKLLTLQPSLFEFANKDAIWGLLIGTFIDLLVLTMVIFLIKKYPNLTFYELLKSKLGVFIAKALLIILLIFILFKALFLYQETYSLFQQNLYDHLPLWVYLISTVLVTGFIASKGSRTIARSLEFYYIIAFVGLFISALTAIISIRAENLLPFFENGTQPIIDSVFKTIFYFGNSFILLLFMGKVEMTKKFILRNYIAYIITFVYLMGSSLIFYEVYGQCVIFSDFTIAELPQYSPFVSDLGRLNWISMVVCTIMLYSLNCIFIWSANTCTKWISNTKDSGTHTIINIGLVVLIAFFYNFNLTGMLENIYSYWSYASLGILCLFTVISIILLCFKKKNEQLGGNNEQST
ncbi:MAG: GerAB/ArcD/ProY family transporter [Clostridia bacterium]|nr:GerAB/ArcD/ProY family transporter [Clostridia bacterium]